MIRRLAPTLAFSCSIAALVILIGPRDLESYDTAFFSLDRGTAVQSEHVLGHPVYTLSLGLGLRLPLHGSLGASPVAALGPLLPMPLTYGLLLACAIASALMVVRYALEPMCGRLVSWLAVVHLFCSMPIVTYTISSDWPEIVVAYIAIVACVFAPHAMLAARAARSTAEGRLVWLSIAGVVWSLVAVAHSGYWPHIAATLVCAAMLTGLRWDHPVRSRLAAVATLAVVAIVPVSLQAPDILRELSLAGAGVRRAVQGPVGNVLSANLSPFAQMTARMPYTNLVLALVAMGIGLRSSDTRDRWLIVASGGASVLLGIAASTLAPGLAVYAPSNTWAIRDYAGVFAILAAACAAGTVMRSTTASGSQRSHVLLLVLALASLQGPLYAGRLIRQEMNGGGDARWTRDLSSAETRVQRRGVSPDLLQPGARIALWPGTRARMRADRANSADFPDAGYALVTTGVKDRTMRGLIEPNELLFNQSTELDTEVLCDARAVHFLQLRYLLTPRGVTCLPRAESRGGPWRPLQDVLVDRWLEVQAASADDRARALPKTQLDAIARAPALSGKSSLLGALAPLPGTSLRIGPRELVLHLDDVARSTEQAIVLPVAYDSAWRTSSGQVRNIGGLLAVVDVTEPHAELTFVPDAVAILLALGMTLEQVVGVAGVIGLVSIRPAAVRDETLTAHDRLAADFVHRQQHRVAAMALSAIGFARPVLREPLYLLSLLYSVAVIARAEVDLLAALLLPIAAFVVARVSRFGSLRNWIALVTLAIALLRVALAGSRAPEALRDPLFWGVVTVVLVAVAWFTGRWPVAAAGASALAGGTAALATLLPQVPNFEVAFPQIRLDVIGRSLTTMSARIGVAATVFLFALWVYAIAFTWRRNRTEKVSTGARGALLVAFILCLVGATPMAAAGWTIALGAVLGLANAPKQM